MHLNEDDFHPLQFSDDDEALVYYFHPYYYRTTEK